MTDDGAPRFRSSLRGLEATRPATVAPEEAAFEETLRPRTLEEFAGQEKLKQNLRISIRAALQRGEPLGHCLFSGPPGLGKTTLAHILAHEMGGKIRVTSGPVLEKPGDLAGLLTGLEAGDVLFIDEIHRLRTVVEEYLYPAMEEFQLDILIDSGPAARSITSGSVRNPCGSDSDFGGAGFCGARVCAARIVGAAQTSATPTAAARLTKRVTLFTWPSSAVGLHDAGQRQTGPIFWHI